jgi:hypothetical protein
MAFRWVSILPCVLVVIFGAIAIKDRMSGGYQAVQLTSAADKKKELAADYLAAGTPSEPSEAIQEPSPIKPSP